MRNIFYLLPLFAMSTASVLAQTNNKAVIDKVVATVGGEIILLSDVESQFAYAKEQQPELPEDYRCVSVQNLVVQKLLVNQAKLDSVEVKDDEVENQIGARIDRLLSLFNQDQKKLEEYYGQTLDQIREQNRTDMRNQLLADRMQSKITDKATITPNEVQRFFSSIPKDSLPYFNAEVEISEIVVKPKVSAEARENARKTSEDLRKKIVEDKEDFAALAKKHSADPGSGSQGGDLGFQKRGTFVPAFEAAAYKLDPNQISQPVETEFGFHIIQLIQRRGNLIHCRHILTKPELTKADMDSAKASLDSVRTQIKDSLITFSEAVKRYGDKNQQSYSNNGRVSNPRSGNTYFEVADLETDVYFAIEELEPGQLTAVVDYQGPDGSAMIRLIQLNSRSKPHKASLALDYDKIQKAALDQKKGDYTEKWVLEKLRSTYLGLDKTFEGCPNLQEMLEAQKP
jgi:peptidyl-prolyl cis-trans isomerase SurA